MNYAKIKQIGKFYFNYRDIAKVFRISPASARVTAVRLVKSGALIRIKRDIYVSSARWDASMLEEKFALANLLQVPSYISLMTALSYYEITTQLQRDFVESVGFYRSKSVDIGNFAFNYAKINRRLYYGFVKTRGFFIAEPEKAFLDAIYLVSFKKYNFDLTSIDAGKLNMNRIKVMARSYPPLTGKLLLKYGYLKQA